MTNVLRGAALCASLLATAHAGPTGDDDVRPPPFVIATVNGTQLTFDNAYETFLASHTGHGVLVRGAEAIRELAGRLEIGRASCRERVS
jgi:hypothetical protein